MKTNDEIFAALSAPFSPERISWRVGSVKKDGTAAMALAYIDARDVMDRLDDVCGPGGWQCRYPHANGKTVCEIGLSLWLPNPEKQLDMPEWVWKADGAGDSDIEAEKGALSDSFKRAAVRWGVGRYLYHLASPWVKIDQYKKILPEELSKLEALLRRSAPILTPRSEEPPHEDRTEPSSRKSAAQAKRDGDNDKLKAEIAGLDHEGLADFHANFDRYTGHVPVSWLDPVRDMLESRLIELNGASNIAEGEAELDAGFRGAIGSGRADRVAGNNGAVAA